MGLRSFRIHPHHHTSYPALALLLLITGFTLAAVSMGASAGTLSDGGSISLNGAMPGPPPNAAPTMESPANGQRFSKLPVTVSGACVSGLRVVVIRNNQLAGQTYCNSSGRYSLLIDLVPGQNDLSARQYDALNQPSPGSMPVTVFYDKPVTAIPAPGQPPAPKLVNPSLNSQPFLVSSNFAGHDIFPDTEFSLPIELSGGIAPYAVHVDWGDGGSSLLSISKPEAFYGRHTYASPGKFKVIIKATDSNGAAAYFQSALTVNGKTVSPPATTNPGRQMVILWPIFIVIAALVLGFWLGERFEDGRLRRRAEKAPSLT